VPTVPPKKQTEGNTSSMELAYSEVASCRLVAVQIAMKLMIPAVVFILFSVGVPVVMFAHFGSKAEDNPALSLPVLAAIAAILSLIISVCIFRRTVQSYSTYHVSLDRGFFSVGYGALFNVKTHIHLLRFVKASHYSGSGYSWSERTIKMDTFSSRGKVFLCREGPTVIVSISSSNYVEFSCEDPQRFETALNSMIRQQEDLLSQSPFPMLLGSGGIGLSPFGTSGVSRSGLLGTGTTSSGFSSGFHRSGTSSSGIGSGSDE